jgi:hypothetical protein
MRWRLVAETDDEEIAAGVMELLVRALLRSPVMATSSVSRRLRPSVA